MSDILKDAIAQAKVLREVAVENAKAILLESFEPKINSILSSKLTKEIEGDDDKENFEDDSLEETEDPGTDELELDATDQDVTSDLEETEDPDKKDQDITPNLNEKDDKLENPEDNDEDDLEFESILKELDDEIEDKLSDEKLKDESPTEDEDLKEDKEEINEPVDKLSEEDEKEINTDKPVSDDDDDEEINIESILSEDDEIEDELSDEELEDKKSLTEIESLRKQNLKLKKQLAESNAAIKVLNEQMNDINILNHKLVHTVKLFRNFNLSNESKMKIVENFDRAKSVREIKLIYTTLYESLKNTGMKRTNKSVRTIAEVKNTGASKTIIGGEQFAKSTIISEGADLEARFKKLANIKD